MEESIVSFDRVASTYDSTREDSRPEVMEALAGELGGCGSVLEVGIGTGRVGGPLHDLGVPIVGVDVSPGMLAVARGKGIDRLVIGDACRLPFRADAFDAVLAVLVMHLVEDLSLLLAEARRVCRGLLVTLGERYDPEDSPFHGYDEALVQRGFRRGPRVEGPEWELAEVVRPTVHRRALETELTGEWGPQIDKLERRDFSSTWDVPDDLHQAAIAHVRQRYAGARPPTRCEVFILAWDVADLTDDALLRVRERAGPMALEPADGGPLGSTQGTQEHAPNT